MEPEWLRGGVGREVAFDASCVALVRVIQRDENAIQTAAPPAIGRGRSPHLIRNWPRQGIAEWLSGESHLLSKSFEDPGTSRSRTPNVRGTAHLRAGPAHPFAKPAEPPRCDGKSPNSQKLPRVHIAATYSYRTEPSPCAAKFRVPNLGSSPNGSVLA